MDVVAIGVVDVDLHDLGARHVAQPRFDPVLAQRFAKRRVALPAKRHMLQPDAVIACGRVVDSDQMHDARRFRITTSAASFFRLFSTRRRPSSSTR